MATLTSRYRFHRTTLIEANNAIMALLVGAQFASTSLGLSTGSKLLISDMYPQVRHIERFQLKTERAQELLTNSEAHLATIALPYALSVHEDFINQVKDDLPTAGLQLLRNGRKWNAENMHSIILDSLGVQSQPDLSEFDLLRRIRNTLIHSGGKVDEYLEEGVSNLTADAALHWEQTTGRSATEIIATERVALTAGEIMLAFSITRHLSKLVHECTINTFPRDFWLKDCISEFEREYRKQIKQGKLLRTKLVHWAKIFYEDFNFTWEELRATAISSGLRGSQLRLRNEMVA